MKVLVMGGAGRMGRIAVRDLVENIAVDEILVADLDLEKAEDLVKTVTADAGGKRVSAHRADLADRQATLRLADGAAVLLNATSLTTESGQRNAILGLQLALEAGAHWVDLCSTYEQTLKQLDLHEDFQKRDLTAVLGAGAAPGITSVMARWAVDRLDEVEAIHQRFGCRDLTSQTTPIAFAYDPRAILAQFTTPDTKRLKDGRIVQVAALSDPEPVDFPPPIGRVECVSIRHPEAATYPRYFGSKGLRDLTVKLQYPEATVDRLKFLIAIGMASREPIPAGDVHVRPYDVLAAILSKVPPSEAEPSDYTMWKVVVEGREGRERVAYTLYHPSESYVPWRCGSSAFRTGVCASIVAGMLGTGAIATPGVFAPEGCVNPVAFFGALSRRGLRIHATKEILL